MENLYKLYCRSYKLDSETDRDFFEVVSDIYFSDEVQSLQQYEQHLEIDRLQHITTVAYLTYKISKKAGIDYKSATRAAVMHDLVYYDWRDGKTGGWHRLHGYKHPKYACMNAAELSPTLTNKESEIIKCHMWPLTLTPPKSKEGFVVTFADKYCAAIEVYYSVNKKYRDKFTKMIEEL